jgi:two-component system, LytTR family, response regulator
MQAMSSVSRSYLSHFTVREGERFLLLRLEEIRWIEARANYVRVHAEHGAYIQRDSLRRLEPMLDPERFLRISRYAIVNLDAVRSLERTANGNLRLHLEGGEQVRTTRAYRGALKRLLSHAPRPH